jgi:hypothetical protein
VTVTHDDLALEPKIISRPLPDCLDISVRLELLEVTSTSEGHGRLDGHRSFGAFRMADGFRSPIPALIRLTIPEQFKGHS